MRVALGKGIKGSGFPLGFSDKEIFDEIARLSGDLQSPSSHLNTPYFVRITAGLSEIQRRSSGRFSLVAMILSFLAVVLAGISLFT